ncbi:CPBP family intramembrane glutamic endopeptidase [Glaciibacter superstes]|uniref:CPBP family intramembrane glutamic endopeptidase n=1 Tax=Glaciibacter superstes TaxID=501023 RepID=UPI0003B30918|nr:type II CAAX endopeptidase family protein [Glaciibacter superstes]
MDRINQRQLISFAIVCTAITGSLWVAASLMGTDVTTWPAFLVFGLGASGPSLAALVMRVIGGRQREPRARLAPPWLWFPAAIVLGAMPAFSASLLAEPSGFWQRITESITDQISGSGGPLLFVILYLIAGPLSEEFGWRGYVQPRIRQALTPLTTSVIIGLAWAAWHVPLFFLNGTTQSRIGFFTLQGAMFLLTMIPLSVTFLYVSETLRGGVWAAITIHFANNVALTFAPAPSAADSALVLATAMLLAAFLLVRMRAIGATVAVT